MIEMMLEAERALAVGLIDQADRLFGQVVAADPRNSIAIVGLARVALERGDERGAYLAAKRALAIDPDNPMASHMAMRMAEILRARGETLPPGPPPPAQPPVARRRVLVLPPRRARRGRRAGPPPEVGAVRGLSGGFSAGA